MTKPGHDDPTERAEKLRECMAEIYRQGKDVDDEQIDALTSSAHESIRVALQLERERHGVDPRDG